MRFANQVAIVTGAGRGIGHAIALRLASEGARVAVVSRTEQNASKTAEEINAKFAGLAKAYAVGGLGYLFGLIASTLFDLPTGAVIVWAMAVVGIAFAISNRGTSAKPTLLLS